MEPRYLELVKLFLLEKSMQNMVCLTFWPNKIWQYICSFKSMCINIMVFVFQVWKHFLNVTITLHFFQYILKWSKMDYRPNILLSWWSKRSVLNSTWLHICLVLHKLMSNLYKTIIQSPWPPPFSVKFHQVWESISNI